MRCHGLAPWSFTIAAIQNQKHKYEMPRACPVEFSRLPLSKTKNTNTRCHGLVPWSFHARGYIAANVKLHGTSPWHPSVIFKLACSGNREAPRDKPVASKRDFKLACSGNRETPRGKPVASSNVCRKWRRSVRRGISSARRRLPDTSNDCSRLSESSGSRRARRAGGLGRAGVGGRSSFPESD